MGFSLFERQITRYLVKTIIPAISLPFYHLSGSLSQPIQLSAFSAINSVHGLLKTNGTPSKPKNRGLSSSYMQGWYDSMVSVVKRLKIAVFLVRH